ncbi:MAG: PD40 domain-containing protein, partial [Bacteroidales bacterium]|nr:PD40 domain-containing protein [Bacteroidales bacterium]
PNIISTEKNERDFALSPTGKEIFYSLVLPKSNFSAIIYLYHDGAFWSQTQVAPFSGEYSDLEPAYSPDGNSLFFISKRPLTTEDKTNDWNIWYVSKKGKGWGSPQPVDTLINTTGDEYYPSVAENGNLYFTANKKSGMGAEDIYFSKFENGKYTKPINPGSGVNSETWEFNAFIAPDESYMLFSSFNREDGFGGGDLYISFRENDTTWTKAKNLGPDINSDKLDYCPAISPDGKYLFFTSQRTDPAINNHRKKSLAKIINLANGIENGNGNIYWVAFNPDVYR